MASSGPPTHERRLQTIFDEFKNSCRHAGMHAPDPIVVEFKNRMRQNPESPAARQINLENFDLDDTILSLLLDALATYPTILELNFSGNKVSSRGASKVIRFLRKQIEMAKTVTINKRLTATFLGSIDLSRSHLSIDKGLLDEIELLCECLQYVNTQVAVRKLFIARHLLATEFDSAKMPLIWSDVVAQYFPQFIKQSNFDIEAFNRCAPSTFSPSRSRRASKVDFSIRQLSSSLNIQGTPKALRMIPRHAAELAVLRALQTCGKLAILTRWQYYMLGMRELRGGDYERVDTLARSPSRLRSIGSDMMASNLFRMIDGNGRGYVTTDDMAKAVASSPEIAEMFVRVIEGGSSPVSMSPDRAYAANVQMEATNFLKSMTTEDSNAPISEQMFIAILTGAFSSNMSPLTVRSESPSPGFQRAFSVGSLDSYDFRDDESHTSRGSRASVHYTGYEFAKQVHTIAAVFIEQMRKELSQKNGNRTKTTQVKLIDNKSEDLIIQEKNRKSYKSRSRWVDESGIGMPVLKIPASLSAKNFKSVQTLVLRNNSMAVVQVSVLKPLENLRTLDISHNNLSDITGRFPKTLTSLDVSYNQLRTLTSICKCKELIELNATNNLINVIEALPLKLEKLYLSDNFIQDYLSFRMLSLTSHLRELSLSGNPVVEKFKDIRARLNSLFVNLEVYDGEALPRSVNTRIAKKISLRATSKELGGYIKREERSQQEADAQRYEAHKEILEKKHKAFEDLINRLREIRGTQTMSPQEVHQSSRRLSRSYSLRRKSINYIGDGDDDDEVILASRSGSPSQQLSRSMSADSVGSMNSQTSTQRRNSMTSDEREALLRRTSLRRRSTSDPSRRRSISGSSRPGSGLAGLFGVVDSLEPISETPQFDNASVDSLEEDTPKLQTRAESNEFSTFSNTNTSTKIPSFSSYAATDSSAQKQEINIDVTESTPEVAEPEGDGSPSAQLKSVFNSLSVPKSRSPVLRDTFEMEATKSNSQGSYEQRSLGLSNSRENPEILTFMRPQAPAYLREKRPDSFGSNSGRFGDDTATKQKISTDYSPPQNEEQSLPAQGSVAGSDPASAGPDSIDDAASVASEITIVTDGGTVMKKKFGLKSAVKLLFAKKKAAKQESEN